MVQFNWSKKHPWNEKNIEKKKSRIVVCTNLYLHMIPLQSSSSPQLKLCVLSLYVFHLITIEFKSGWFPGQTGNRVTPQLALYFLVVFAQWASPPSSMNCFFFFVRFSAVGLLSSSRHIIWPIPRDYDLYHLSHEKRKIYIGGKRYQDIFNIKTVSLLHSRPYLGMFSLSSKI